MKGNWEKIFVWGVVALVVYEAYRLFTTSSANASLYPSGTLGQAAPDALAAALAQPYIAPSTQNALSTLLNGQQQSAPAFMGTYSSYSGQLDYSSRSSYTGVTNAAY